MNRRLLYFSTTFGLTDTHNPAKTIQNRLKFPEKSSEAHCSNEKRSHQSDIRKVSTESLFHSFVSDAHEEISRNRSFHLSNTLRLKFRKNPLIRFFQPKMFNKHSFVAILEIDFTLALKSYLLGEFTKVVCFRKYSHLVFASERQKEN